MADIKQRTNILDAQLLDRMHALHYQYEVILFERHAFRHFENRLLQFSFALLTFVDRGTADVFIDDKPYHLSENEQLILLPNQSISLQHLSEDFHAQFVLLSNDFVSLITTEDSYRFIQMIRSNPHVHLQAHIRNAFLSCYDLLRATIMQRDNPFRRQMLYHIIKTYIYGVMYYVEPVANVVQSREAELTYRFMELVEQHYREQHALSFYAERMHLSGKYISRCVRITTGSNGVQTIANCIMQQARIMLLARQKSIAEIGYELGFADQSAFGKFFHAHEHVSPLQWRKGH